MIFKLVRVMQTAARVATVKLHNITLHNFYLYQIIEAYRVRCCMAVRLQCTLQNDQITGCFLCVKLYNTAPVAGEIASCVFSTVIKILQCLVL